MIDRRTFIAKNFFSLSGFFLSPSVHDFFSLPGQNKRLVIVYNEGFHLKMHEYLDSRKAEERIASQVSKLMLLRRIREEGFPVLLIDGGNLICPFTSDTYPKIDSQLIAATWMHYDAAIPGESELSSGTDVWKKMAGEQNFHWLACNYAVTDTPLEKLVKPFMVKDLGGMRIGITGIGMQPGEGVRANGWEAVDFIPPVIALNRTAAVLKERGCNWVVCFNHGGIRNNQTNSIDALLAKESEQVDLIVGCHSRFTASGIRLYTNKSGKKTAVFQITEQENFLARIDLFLPVKGGNKTLTFNELTAIKKNAE